MNKKVSQASKIQIFVSYSHKDKKEKEELQPYLKNLEKLFNVGVWHDGLIPAGGSIEPIILDALATSNIILLLISTNYINSDFCSKIEMKEAFKRHKRGECVVVPIILKKIVTMEGLPFSKIKCVPSDAKPISQYRPKENGYVEAVTSLLELLKTPGTDLSKKLKPSVAVDDVAPITKPAKKPPQSGKPKGKRTKRPGNPCIELYAQGKLTKIEVSQELVDQFRNYPNKFVDFRERATTLTQHHIEKYRSSYRKSPAQMTAIKHLQCFRNYLFQLCSYMTQYLLGNVGVRVHFRGLSGQNYVGLVVHTGTLKATPADMRKWAKELTAIPINQGMIYHSNRLKAPLIKSLNEAFHERGKHDDIWVEYLTCALTDLDTSINALLSMGISISKETVEEAYPLLQIMAYTRFDKLICDLLIEYIQGCRRCDKRFDVKSMLDAYN